MARDYNRQMDAPRVFISYSHDSPEHKYRVLALSDRLRREGVDCSVDQYEQSPKEGWPLWCQRQVEQATFVNNLAGLYDDQAKYAEAEPLYQRSLAIYEKALGPDHPDAATILNNLAELYHSQEKFAEAEPLYQRSLAILEKALGPDHPNVARSLNNLAELYRSQRKYAEAVPLLQRSLAIFEKALGQDHPHTRLVRSNLDALRTRTSPGFVDGNPAPGG